jgi:predicted HicB family RNase H-like nuclease
MNEAIVPQSFESRCQRVLQVAKQLFQSNPDWVTFFREVLGIDGAARTVFADQNDYIAFEKSDSYMEIQQMVTSLRTRKIPGPGSNEPTRVITVRLPESLHEALKAEADDHNTSMNKLCISKLLQVLVVDESQPAPPRRTTMPTASPSPAMSRSMSPPQNPSQATVPVAQGAIGSYSNL